MLDFNQEYIRAISIAIVYIALFLGVELWYKLANPPVEKTRKFVHIISGVIALSFAYLFENSTYVLFLCIGFVLILYLTEKFGLLASIHNIDRPSKGSFYFPVAVFLIFYISQLLRQPEFYFLSILVLAVSDTLAALTGKKYGFKLYEIENSQKSFEGSAIFFLSTFVILQTGILLLTDVGRVETTLGALYISILVTAFEAISTDGADNIFIPLGTLYILNKITTKPPEELLFQIIAIFIIYLITFLVSYKKNKLSYCGIMGFALLSYAAFSLRGLLWYLPILLSLVLINHLNIFLPENTEKKDAYKIVSVFYSVLPVLFWVILSNLIRNSDYEYFLAYLATISALLVIIWEGRSREIRKKTISMSNNNYHYIHPIFRSIVISLIFSLLAFPYCNNINLVVIWGMLFLMTFLADRLFWVLEDNFVSKWQFLSLIKLRSLVVFVFSVIIAFVNSMFQILS